MYQQSEDAKLVRVFKALADPKRLRMVQEIAAAGELSCGQVGELFHLSQPTISHHLKILAEAGVLTVRESAQHHFISVNRTLIQQLAGVLPMQLAAAPARKRASNSRT
ncbi:MAG: metalloregulator ArsR/SmtB family transcription factor [Vicinamibacterales bacterium]